MPEKSEYSLEEGLALLEATAQRLEKNDVSLADSIELFRQSAAIYANCQKQLGDLRMEITKISRDIESNSDDSNLE